MMECKYCDDLTGICTNGDCPMCADACPVPDTEGICKYEQREERAHKLTPKGCASIALKDAKLVSSTTDPAVDVFWGSFTHLMEKFGYVSQEADTDELENNRH